MQTILKGAVPIRHLTNLRQKINLCVDLGIENIYILRFCDEMAALEPAEFVGKVLGTCNLQALVCGFDWSYGIHGSGSWKTLKEEAPYEVAVVDAVVEDGVKISSTRIRQLIEKGNVAHEIVYKNPNFVSYDSFLKDILGSIRDNLDVVDRQLEIVYSEISEKTNTRQIGMDERGFKVFVASSINDIVNEKMKKSVGFTTDFKKCSSILAQYIYVKDFVSGENNQLKMIEYFERLNLLSVSDLDFKAPIRFEDKYVSRDPFCSILGDYWQKVVNTDYEWHGLQPGGSCAVLPVTAGLSGKKQARDRRAF